MFLDVLINACEVGLVEHAELRVLGFRSEAFGGGDDEVEGALEDAGVGDSFDGREGKEGEGFLEAEDYAAGEEKEVA